MRHQSILLLAVIAAFAVFLLAFFCCGVAEAKVPTGDFAPFIRCPRFAKRVRLCVYAELEHGQITLGKQTIPISRRIVVQGGIISKAGGPQSFVGAVSGETVARSADTIPGGLAGLCQEVRGRDSFVEGARLACELAFEGIGAPVMAVTELVRPASQIGISTESLEDAYGTAVSLPVRVRLEGELLGNSCDVGSSSSPIIVKLTDGTTAPDKPNTAISGSVGAFHLRDHFELIEDRGITLVGNEFSVPDATGCGGSLSHIFDPAIDRRLGLPSPDGHNMIVQYDRILEGGVRAVIASEK